MTTTGLFYSISLTLLFAIATLLSFRNYKGDKVSIRFLALYFWCYWYGILLAYFMVFGHSSFNAPFMRTGNITTLLVFPCSFLYVRRILFGNKLSATDLLHLIPALLYIVDYLPFFLLSGAEKLQIQSAMTPLQRQVTYSEGWFMPDYGHFIIRYAMAFIYSIWQIVMVQKVFNSKQSNIIKENIYLRRWLFLLLISQVFITLAPLATALFTLGPILIAVLNLPTLLAAIAQCYFVLFEPRAFDSATADSSNMVLEEQVYANDLAGEEEEIFTEELLPTSQTMLSEESVEIISAKVNELMGNHRPYLQPRYKLSDLSRDTGIGIHKLSAYFNKHRGTNFYGYLNQLRVDYCLAKMQLDEHKSKTLEAIATESGFQSRTTFIRAFKSLTGFTPSQYLENLAQSEKK